MSRSFSSLAMLLPLITMMIGPLVVVISHHTGWPAGFSTLVLCSWLVCLAGLSGRGRSLVYVLSVVGAIAVAEIYCSTSPYSRYADISSAVLCCTVLAVLGFSCMARVNRLQEWLNEFSHQTQEYLQQLCDPERLLTSNLSGIRDPWNQMMETGPDELAGGSSRKRDKIIDTQFPVLFMTLQEIGRRVSAELDLDSLIDTVRATAESILQCGTCEIHLWNPHQQKLVRVDSGTAPTDCAYQPRLDAGLTSWAVKNKQIVTRSMAHSDPAFARLLEEEWVIPDAVAPLIAGTDLVGVMVLHDVEEDSPSFLRLLFILSSVTALGIKNAQLFRKVEDMARRDGLTGLLNHASFQENLETLVKRAHENNSPLTVIMSDIDHFKRFNDTHGHQAGDLILQEFARLWQILAPSQGVVARYGGEEFICALPDRSIEVGEELAEALRHTFETVPVAYDNRLLSVTASFGVVSLGGSVRTPTELVRAADAALYQSKREGRNRVTLVENHQGQGKTHFPARETLATAETT